MTKAQEGKVFLKPSKPCRLGIHWIALVEYSQMSTPYARVSVIFKVLASFIFRIGKLATTSIRVKGSLSILRYIHEHIDALQTDGYHSAWIR